MIDYLAAVCRENNQAFHHNDYTDAIKPTDGLDGITVFGNSSYAAAAGFNLAGVHVVRNPINIIVSAYHSHLHNHPEDGWPELTKQRALLRQVSYEEGLLLTVTFLERADINQGAEGCLYALRNWDLSDSRFKTIRIEDLVANPSREFGKLLGVRVVPEDADFTFERYADGSALESVDFASHYRSGATLRWDRNIPSSILEYVRVYFPALLRTYYPDVILANRDLNRPFYELDRDVRISIGNDAAASGNTVLSRWNNLKTDESNEWTKRAEAAVSMLGNCTSVADLGCGTMGVKALLANETHYIPVDVVRRGSTSVVVDFNTDDWHGLKADSALALGLMEYLKDIPAFLARARSQFRCLVASYNVADVSSLTDNRREHAWINDFGAAEIETVFYAAGWRISSTMDLGNQQMLWKLI